MRKIFNMALFFLPVLFSGCARTVIVQEALQLPEGAKVYTNYNIWYDDPDDISSLNYQSGKFMPFGTEVEIVEADGRSFTFREKSNGQKFRISYDESWMMIPIEDYLKRFLTTKDREQLSAGIKPAVLDKVSKGLVDEGMTRKEVLLAYGYPVVHRTPSLKDDTWIYWIKPLVTTRVVFKGDIVIAILKFDE